ncbi:Rha family transcriptional regulator [Pseudomonas proteolytica]|uniref:Rha family transcriptional regulator n=1 Tax=Pseudomonas proteolytica TaxID=219574 RepID=UPI0014758754|nr:Rha family transcriptional regulator [Pseudomonas proteolytica]NMZ40418.1 ORF6N domain-containing protein [Pseudomonas proteolytica]
MHQHTESINSPNNLAPRFSQSENVARQIEISSLEIAELVGSRHDNVRKTIERLVDREVIQQPALQEVKNHLGQGVATYMVRKRDSFVVVAQLSPEFTAALVDRWQELEAQQASPSIDTDEGKLLLIQDLATKQLALIAENKYITQQRDHAIETKAEIGSRREATAMATASAAVRQAQKLKQELGLGTRQASVVAVEKITGRKFGISGYVPLRRWCKDHGITATKVLHPTFGTVRSWPAGAWMDVYQVNIAELFAAELKEAV